MKEGRKKRERKAISVITPTPKSYKHITLKTTLLKTYHGAGNMTVRRSDMAIDMRTRLVGDLMCFLLSTMMIRMLAMKVTAKMAGMM